MGNWKKEESLQQIARLFDRNHSSVQRIFAESGGIGRAEGQRSRLELTSTEREEISRLLPTGQSIRRIAQAIGRAPSTIKSHKVP